jgi:excisionase family DNA binding protein
MASKKRAGRRKDHLLTISEAATELDVSPATLRNWDRAGKLKAHRHPINGYRLYRASEIVALKNEIQGLKA